MATLRALLAELIGLFVDDGSLVLGVLLLVGALAVAAALQPSSAPILGVVLVVGCLALLAATTLRGTRR